MAGTPARWHSAWRSVVPSLPPARELGPHRCRWCRRGRPAPPPPTAGRGVRRTPSRPSSSRPGCRAARALGARRRPTRRPGRRPSCRRRRRRRPRRPRHARGSSCRTRLAPRRNVRHSARDRRVDGWSVTTIGRCERTRRTSGPPRSSGPVRLHPHQGGQTRRPRPRQFRTGTQCAKSATSSPSSFPLSSARRRVTASVAQGCARNDGRPRRRQHPTLTGQRDHAVACSARRRSPRRSPRGSAWPPRGGRRCRPPGPPARAGRRGAASSACDSSRPPGSRWPMSCTRPAAASRRRRGDRCARSAAVCRAWSSWETGTPGLSGRSAPEASTSVISSMLRSAASRALRPPHSPSSVRVR